MTKAKKHPSVSEAKRIIAMANSNLRLMQKSKLCSQAQVVESQRELSSLLLLEYNRISLPPSQRVLGLSSDQTLAERKQALGLAPHYDHRPSAKVAKFSADLSKAASKSYRSRWTFRMAEQSLWAHSNGWYPFAGTFTIDQMRYNAFDYWSDSRNFYHDFYRPLADTACKACGERNWRKTRTSITEYAQFGGAIEHGKSDNHHHFHNLMWLRDVPDYVKRDPNRGLAPVARYQRRAKFLESNWQYGFCNINYWRFNGDIWSKLGFCWPLATNGKPLETHHCLTSGMYVTKYIQKEDKTWPHRMRANKGLGTQTLFEMFASVNVQTLEALTWRPSSHEDSVRLETLHRVPCDFLRVYAKAELFRRNYLARRLDPALYINLDEKPFVEMMRTIDKKSLDVFRLQADAKFDFFQDHLPDAPYYCRDRQFRAHDKVARFFPVIFGKVIRRLPPQCA